MNSEIPKLPSVESTNYFQFARKMHSDNLGHQPLPDTLGYRNLTKVGEHRNSDINVKPYSKQWKSAEAFEPNCCCKVHGHRPKTSDVKKNDFQKNGKQRPSTSTPDLRGNLNKSMSLMDLAICWDLKPDDPEKEPKPPKHIDGSNGSRAPAVFTLVYAPKDDLVKKQKMLQQSNPIFHQKHPENGYNNFKQNFDNDNNINELRKESYDLQKNKQHDNLEKRSISASSGSSHRVVAKKPECDGIHGCGTLSNSTSRKSSHDMSSVHSKEAWNIDRNKKRNECNRLSIESFVKNKLGEEKQRQISPGNLQNSQNSTNDSFNKQTKHKHCLCCNREKHTEVQKSKEQYKLAFKAGNPNSVHCAENPMNCKVKIPKLRHPYAKKSYMIPTLSPPFTVWSDSNATGYPEHWRLASVYQHAYKPPELRRKPLITSVYQ